MIFIITGVSRGLGEALALQCLNNGDQVIGIGRSHSIKDQNFHFIACDLSDLAAVKAIDLELPDGSITLINNAGIIGEIGRLSEMKESCLEDVLKVNTIAPQILLDKVYKKIKNKSDFTLVNISSGAANRSIPSWAAYCASKAALNMLSENFYLEEQELGNNCKVYAVAPGVIDTDMQTQIRAADSKDFSAVQNFISMKENKDLFSANEAAKRLLKLLNQPYSGEIFNDLRTITV